ncbi:MAG: hydantoinase B/oxoprolinase family protein [Alphaproteobacteria bacterium]|nr:hydantoinase B/oxoprolinase family protein [Alphaproteobacteria bacterium]
MTAQWQFWIDRGGTFTDIVAKRPDGTLATHKLLSENPERYKDAALQGIRELLGLAKDAPLTGAPVEAVKMGTTVATNALLERKGERVAVAITKGFKDQLRIAYQNRPKLFVRRIVLPELLYETAVEIDERMDAQGNVLRTLDEAAAERDLRKIYDQGIRALAIVLLHGYRYPAHEKALGDIARKIGFTQISISHEVSPLMKIVGRGDTTVVDAYVSPILRRYVDRVAGELGGTRLMFMQSNGGLVDARYFQGKDSILSGPAGGIVGAARTAAMAGFDKIIGFDMGGTSTDVTLYNGEYERTFETIVAGVRMRAPMMKIHTVAAGGGSILFFDGTRFRCGPESAGANPGPACYRRGGPLAVTDANVMVGKIVPDFFPAVFGPNGDQRLDAEIVRAKFAALAAEVEKATGEKRTPEAIADGFLKIAVENMANAIKQISIQRGYDVSGYALNCFGGAGGQHACKVADALGMTTVFVHPLAGVLSAYGMGLADLRVMREKAVEAKLADAILPTLETELAALAEEGLAEMRRQGIDPAKIEVRRKLHLKYEGTDSALVVDFGTIEAASAAFVEQHRQRYGFSMPGKAVIVEAVAVEVVGHTESADDVVREIGAAAPPAPAATVKMYADGETHSTPVFLRDALKPGMKVPGPAIVSDRNATTVIEPGWAAEVTARDHLVLRRVVAIQRQHAIGTKVDPVMLEVFNNLFMSIAEQMGVALQNTAYSVNIKERLDFSCALFDRQGNLIANAPHMPVHLGSMGESVAAVTRAREGTMRPGDVFVLNAPYNGGTHLPDVTVVMPVFDEAGKDILFFVASRGHQADIGGLTPGSMPPGSTTVEEEGVLIDNFQLVDQGRFREAEMVALLKSGKYPARNPAQNIGDLKAQIAACEKGAQELRKMVREFGLDVVRAYMGHVQDNAEEQVRRVLDVLKDGAFAYPMDDGAVIKVKVSIDKATRSAILDFTGTSAQRPNNFNAPASVCMAAVLYVFRTLVEGDIPMNAGVMKPLKVIIPEGCMLRPQYPAAVVAGNVETSQAVTDTIYGALGVMAGAQGTMNNFTFGNDKHQYYETIAGGSGAGPGFDGCDAVQTHMTNSRLTDPEVLEWRFPVRVESFEIRRGSGGKGEFRGGDGTIRKVRFLEDMTCAILANRRKVEPFGANGGGNGKLGRNWVERTNGTIEEKGATAQWDVKPGDMFVIETPGGGGYGKAN